MKSWLLLLFVCLFSSFSIKITESDPLLVYKPGYKLQISDFTPTLKELPNGRTAISAIGLHMVKDSTKRAGWKAQAVFNKNMSYWYLSGQVWAKDIILQHEQIHFDITHVVATMYNKVLDSMPYKSRIMLEPSYTFYANKLDSMQKWYDRCTGEDPNAKAQEKCNKKVDSIIQVIYKSLK